jgi:hypothetical protein
MSFLPPWGADLALGIAAVGTAATVIGLFMRATRSGKKKEETPLPAAEAPIAKEDTPVSSPVGIGLKATDVEKARRALKVLTLERDALSMAISKFFEAEDEGEISNEDRAKLSKDYEDKVKALSDKIRQTELVVGLYELEKIREEIVKRFDAKLNETNTKIEELRKELKLELPIEEEKKTPAKKAKEKTSEEEKEAEEKAKQKKPKMSEIDEKIEKLRQEVLKELEELEKLEIEI